MWKRFVVKWLKRISIFVVLLVAIASIPILRNEGLCVGTPEQNKTGGTALIEKSHQRDEINTYLTYPEWMIVHAYEDFAAVTRRSSESDFHYFSSIRNYWSNLCDVSKRASSQGTISTEYRVMLYVIGVSFSAEFGFKGVWENTIGAISTWFRGTEPTPEDSKIRDISDDYAKFLLQNPWFKYPFWSKLNEFWSDASWSGGNWVRKLERRLAFSMEYSVKALYGKLIGAGAAATMPAAESLRSVLIVPEGGELEPVDGVKVVQQSAEGVVIDTPRYRAFTDLSKALAAKGYNFKEIAGNQKILVTVLFPEGAFSPTEDVQTLFTADVQSRPGWDRYGLVVKVPALLEFVRAVNGGKGEMEHIYDY